MYKQKRNTRNILYSIKLTYQLWFQCNFSKINIYLYQIPLPYDAYEIVSPFDKYIMTYKLYIVLSFWTRFQSYIFVIKDILIDWVAT